MWHERIMLIFFTCINKILTNILAKMRRKNLVQTKRKSSAQMFLDVCKLFIKVGLTHWIWISHQILRNFCWDYMYKLIIQRESRWKNIYIIQNDSKYLGEDELTEQGQRVIKNWRINKEEVKTISSILMIVTTTFYNPEWWRCWW